MKTHKSLGMRRRTRMGELKLVYGVPGTKEIFALREKSAVRKYLPAGVPMKKLTITRFDMESKKESLVSHFWYTEQLGRLDVHELHTQPEHRRRGAASALIAYLKARKMPIALLSGKKLVGFYKEMGFEVSREQPLKTATLLRLPAGKPLAKRGKFAIAEAKR